MSRESITATISSVQVARKYKALRSMVLALLVAVIAVDQTIKWWAWRHAPAAQINYGGNAFVGATISKWYANPLTGALLDLADVGLLSIAVALLLRRRRPTIVLVTGAIMIGGWISNLVDRLGMHYWTAPGSVRGAVDFIPLGPIDYNVADVFIAFGTVFFLLAVCAWAARKPATTGSWTPAKHPRPRTRRWMPAIAAATCLIGVVGFGAVHDNGVTAPSTSADVATSSPA
jgi:lipoprotein signal peptidase